MGAGLIGARRRSRATALQVLYELDVTGHALSQVWPLLLEEISLAPRAEEFACELVQGVLQNKERIDGIIKAYAPDWPLNQIPPVDRSLLRLSIYEIVFADKVPPKAAINEAVELAKVFGSDSSPKFVNGVLGSVMAKREDLAGETVSRR